MPPQPGVFAVSHSSSHKVRAGPASEVATVNTLHYESVAGPSSRPHPHGEDPKKDKRRKEVVGKLSKEMADRREDIGRHYAETISDLHSLSIQLSTRPETSPAYNLRLYPITLERGAVLSAIELQERHALQVAQTAYEEERERIEEEWKRGHDRIRERMLEGIEERRKRAREEKDGEGTVADGGGDPQSRPHITRKLRNKLGGASTPPTPVSGGPGVNGTNGSNTSGAVVTGPFLNPHSLSVDELPSAFPLSLIIGNSGGGQSHGGGAGGGGNGRRRPKGAGQAQDRNFKGLNLFPPMKESEYEADLVEIRRGSNRRRRAAAGGLAGKA